MKYIRTKNGIYDEVKVNLIADAASGEMFVEMSGGFISHVEQVIKRADTIEELCDAFVVVGNKHFVWDKSHTGDITLEQVKFAYENPQFEIYGAIWTNKGLIYVAKMNEKGDLELL